MMKRIYTLGMILMIGQMAIAQLSHNFTMESGAMIELQHPIEIGGDELLTDLQGQTFRIGFDYRFGGTAIGNTLRFTEDGMLEGFDSNERTTSFTLSPMVGVDLIDRGTNSNLKESSVSYEVLGRPGSQMLVVQWINVGFQFEHEQFNSSEDFMNFQMILHEDNGQVEYIYGQSRVSRTQSYFGGVGPFIGVASEKLATQLYLSDDSNTPKPFDTLVRFKRCPENGAIFSFVPNNEKTTAPVDVKLAQATKLNAKIYPNPFVNDFNIKLLRGIPGAKILVRSPYGKVVFEGSIEDTVNIDLTGLDQGLYVVQISTTKDTIIKKVMKR